MDLNTIHHAIRNRIQQGARFMWKPSTLAAALASTAIFYVLPESTNLVLRSAQSILGPVGINQLHALAQQFISNLEKEGQEQISHEEIRERFEQVLLERWEESSQDAAVLRRDISNWLQHVQAINVALSGVPTELRESLVGGLIELGSSFEEFRWILIEQSQLLVEGRQQREQLLAEVRGQKRQIARLERELQELPTKFKLLLLFQSERSGSSGGPPPPLLAGDSSPYKGLPAFEKKDAEYFFGREELVEADLMHNLVQGKRFLAVIGRSGSGKSSLVQAGLLPCLDTDTAHQLLGSRDWQIILFKPGKHPLTQLLEHIGSRLNIANRVLLRSLKTNPDQLAITIRQLLHGQPNHVRILLIIDQFEEIFTRCRDEQERDHFIDALLHTSESAASRTIVLVTMRVDFYGHCASHARLRDQIQKHHLLVGPLHEDQLRRVIEQPAKKAGLQLEPGLSETIIKDVADAPSALPLLSQALLETWKRCQGNTLTRQGYEASGGVLKAITRTAESVYTQLTTEEQAIVRHLFLRLVELGENEQYDTRRRALRSELVTIAHPQETEVVESLLVKLADARLITTDQETIEVAHEALIREWEELRKWVDKDRKGLRIHRHLTEAALEWQHLGRDMGDLYAGARLEQACEWAAEHESELNALERAFLEVSKRVEAETRQRELERERALKEEQRLRAEEAEKREQNEKRSNTRLRRRNRVLAFVFVVAFVVAIFAIIQQQSAEEQTRLSQSQAKAGEALFELSSSNFDRALVLALAAARANTEPYPPLLVSRALRRTLDESLIRHTLRAHRGTVGFVAFSPNGEQVLTGNQAPRLWDTKTGQLLYILEGHTDRELSVVFSPNGQQVLTGSLDNTARLWDTTTGDTLHVLKGHTGGVTLVAFSPKDEDEQVLTGSDDGTARLWDTKTGDTLHLFKGHTGGIRSVAFSSSGELVLTGSDDGTARLWQTKTGKSLYVLKEHTEEVTSVAFSPSGELVLTGSDDGAARMWDAKTGQRIYTLEGHTDSVRSVAFSPNGEQVLTDSSDGTVRLWDVKTGQFLYAYTGSLLEAFSPNGEQVLTTGDNSSTARLWDTKTGQPLYVLKGHTNSIQSAIFSPNGDLVLTKSSDQTARVWDAKTGQPLYILKEHMEEVIGGVSSVAFSPNGELVLTGGGGDGTARLWDLKNRRQLKHTGPVGSVTFSPTGKQVLTQDLYGTYLWDTTSGHRLNTLEGSKFGIVMFSPTGKQVLTTNNDGTFYLWDSTNGDRLHVLETNTKGPAVFSPNGEQLLIGGTDGIARLWDTKTGELYIVEQRTNPAISSVAFSPNGEQFLTGGTDGITRLWDAKTRELLYTVERRMNSVLSAAFSPNGEQIVAGGFHGWLDVWNAKTGQELGTLKGGQMALYGVEFSSDGQRILARSNEVSQGKAYLWDAKSGKLLYTFKLENGLDLNYSAIWSPNGKQLLTKDGYASNSSQIVRLWDAETGQLLHSLEGHTSSISSMAFSPNAELVLTGSEDGTARVWDAKTGQPLYVLGEHTGFVRRVAFSPNGFEVLTGSGDGTARLWITDHALVIAKLTERVCNVLTEEQIRVEIPDWRGCEVELEAVAENLAKYNEWQSEE